MNSFTREVRCDGCGVKATSGHLSKRVARLELATRFRPIHIDTLILCPAPPSRLENYFYRPARSRDERSFASRGFFDALIAAAVGDLTASASEEALLAEFQRAGCFLTECCECAWEDAGIPHADLARQFAQLVLRRVQYSYKPKHIVLLSHELEPLIPVFREAGLHDKLLLLNGKSIEIPVFGDSAAIVRFRTDLRGVLAKTLIGGGARQKDWKSSS